MTGWSVFTGDIVGSTEMPEASLSAIFTNLQCMADVVSEWQGGPAHFTRFRGDGWQMLVAPRLVFRTAMAVRAAVRETAKGADTRIGIGFGQTTLTGNDLAGAGGSAFVAAGDALDQMGRKDRMRAPNAPASLRVALALADHIADNWTLRQAQVVGRMLRPEQPTHADVADSLGVTRQTVQRHADSSGLNALLSACAVLEGDRDDI